MKQGNGGLLLGAQVSGTRGHQKLNDLVVQHSFFDVNQPVPHGKGTTYTSLDFHHEPKMENADFTIGFEHSRKENRLDECDCSLAVIKSTKRVPRLDIILTGEGAVDPTEVDKEEFSYREEWGTSTVWEEGLTGTRLGDQVLTKNSYSSHGLKWYIDENRDILDQEDENVNELDFHMRREGMKLPIARSITHTSGFEKEGRKRPRDTSDDHPLCKLRELNANVMDRPLKIKRMGREEERQWEGGETVRKKTYSNSFLKKRRSVPGARRNQDWYRP